jgi:hypothetical protein
MSLLLFLQFLREMPLFGLSNEVNVMKELPFLRELRLLRKLL